jgi:hypothetical protein
VIPISKEQIVAALVMAIKRDRANRYRLTRDWTLPRLTVAVPDFAGKRLLIQDSVITVLAYEGGYESDGCTLSPDEIGDWKPVMAALFHDPWYAELDEIAKAWGWSRAAVRKLGDELFACLMVKTGSPRWLARAYLTFIRPFGGLVRWIAGLAGAVTMVMVCSGCSGCANFPDHFGDEPVTPPQYEDVGHA